MQERGNLVRKDLKQYIESLAPTLRSELGIHGNTFGTGASDGIGRKVELPWARYCSTEMSPSPTQGYYCVIHFATDGSAVFVTVGCGSSRFVNGSSVVLPPEELDARTSWARSVVLENLDSLTPFSDAPEFKARSPLARSFERATAFAVKVPVTEISKADWPALLAGAAGRLKFIYDAQMLGRDQTPADQFQIAMNAVRKPNRASSSQGYGLSSDERRAIELRAMDAAREWLEGEGYRVIDCSANKPFDFLAARDGVELKVEVKGTTSDFATDVLMTRNEVDLHRENIGSTALLICSGIKLQRGKTPSADGGVLDAHVGWDINDWVIEPTAFRISRKIS